MIWRRADRKEDFPTFHHQDARIEVLEADFLVLNKLLLSYVESDMACAKELAETLRGIIKKREQPSA